MLVAVIMVSTLWMGFGAGAAGAANGDCAQPVSDGTKPTTTDCLFLLRSAVGLQACPLCQCDADGNGDTVASDALLCLKVSVGQDFPLDCPDCTTTTTTTTITVSSTTSTSTTSSTLFGILDCRSASDCVEKPGTHCNPNLDICDFPCDEDDDCFLFYECDLDTNLCDEPQ